MNAPLHREMPAGALDAERALSDVTTKWDTDILRQLTDYIAIPAKSPGFDKELCGLAVEIVRWTPARDAFGTRVPETAKLLVGFGGGN